MSEYTLIKLLMLLYYMHIIRTYQGSFGDRRKSRRSAGRMAWGVYVLFQFRIMEADAGFLPLNAVINLTLSVIVYKCSYHIAYRTALLRTASLCAVRMLVEAAVNYMLGKLGSVADTSYDFFIGNIISGIFMHISVYVLKCCRKNDAVANLSFKYQAELFFILQEIAAT